MADETATVERIPGGPAVELVIARPERLAAILQRDDVTRMGEHPLVLVNEGYGVLAVATGPSEPPGRIVVNASVSRLECGESVEVPSADDVQPSWQLLAIRVPPRDRKTKEK